MATIDRKNGTLDEYSSAHFIEGGRSNDPTCPDCGQSAVFRHISVPITKGAQQSMLRYHARKGDVLRHKEGNLSRLMNSLLIARFEHF